MPLYNQATKRFDYYRPSVADRNVVPYHPDILLLWGAHMNLQLVTHETWSYYLLKYALKAEPAGKLTLSIPGVINHGGFGLERSRSRSRS